LIIETPGGGGLGDPREREREALRRDLEAGRVSRAGAASDYGLDV
jgi:N-methylhydantoinase B